ncbi:magnesium transporter [Sulfurospirillum arcachonense]|uniref:magnesium transporter n=1 Tax=Sulfurospirillum arcachonense TaxID=57666 RepID=UPI00046A41BD|nr:magnesium transporter [Sulfurospirillum arcachonense]
MSKNRDVKDSIEIIESYLLDEIDYEISVSDLAKHLKTIKKEDETLFFELLQKFPNDILGDIVIELPEHYLKQIIENIPSVQLTEAIEDLESDDATDLIQDIEEIDEQKAEEILSGLDKEDQEDIKKLIRYDEEEAGAYMQTEVFTASYDEKIQDAVDRLRELKKEGELENIHQVSIVEKLDRLLFSISLEDLITFNFTKSFREEIKGKEDNFKARHVRDDENISKVIELFEDYDLIALPIVDYHGKLLGRITSDDIYDIIQERATDQIYNLAGVDEEAEHEESIFEAGKARVIWLFINLLTAILASAVIGLFENVLSMYVALAVLMPIVASMGGNAGTQSLTIMVRQLALGEIDNENAKEAIKKEMILAIANGFIFALLMGLIAYLWFEDNKIGLVIAASMLVNLLCAGLIGSMVPLMLKRLGIDPAVGSSVFLTTSTDIVGFFSFLGLASLVLM